MPSPNGRSAMGTMAAVAVLGTGGAYFAGTALADVAHRSQLGAAHANPAAPAGAGRQDLLHHSETPDAAADPSVGAARGTARHAATGTGVMGAVSAELSEASAGDVDDADSGEGHASDADAVRGPGQDIHADQGRRRDSEKASAKALEKRDERASARGNGGR